tara:strand:+ start:651 stop:968 length:318 start_codon:yes stop_codon:yes gene_type:complete
MSLSEKVMLERPVALLATWTSRVESWVEAMPKLRSVGASGRGLESEVVRRERRMGRSWRFMVRGGWWVLELGMGLGLVEAEMMGWGMIEDEVWDADDRTENVKSL